MDGICNAMVTGADLSVEDHGVLSSFVQLDYGDGAHQGFGGYQLSRAKNGPTAAAGLWITRILEVLEIGRWENLKGTPCRADVQGGLVRRLGHFTKDKWFDMAAESKVLEEKGVLG